MSNNRTLSYTVDGRTVEFVINERVLPEGFVLLEPDRQFLIHTPRSESSPQSNLGTLDL